MKAKTISQTNFQFTGQKDIYRGKVRDVYNIDDRYLVMIATDRISAFDVVLPKAIPYKGQVLNQIACKFMSLTKDAVPNWMLKKPDPNVTVGYKCEPYPVEMVIRRYLAGHAWRLYDSGKREICGIKLPDGLHENDRLPGPIITPTTKAAVGHDTDITREEIISGGLVSQREYEQMENYTRKLFEIGTRWAATMKLLLVDTKYEFGSLDGKIVLIDEIHTPDSSRYIYAEGYEDRQSKGGPQRQLSKEFLRQWLIMHGFQGRQGEEIPDMSDQFIDEISDRYIELYEKITGETFVKANTENIGERIMNSVEKCLKELNEKEKKTQI
jgi:phosphoribosylaminoimidazole-succinocarboxamide synthase